MSAVRDALTETLERAQQILQFNEGELDRAIVVVGNAVIERDIIAEKVDTYRARVEALTEAIDALPAEVPGE